MVVVFYTIGLGEHQVAGLYTVITQFSVLAYLGIYSYEIAGEKAGAAIPFVRFRLDDL